MNECWFTYVVHWQIFSACSWQEMGEGWKTWLTMFEWHWKNMENRIGTKHFVFRILQNMPFCPLWSTESILYYDRQALIRDGAPYPKPGDALCSLSVCRWTPWKPDRMSINNILLVAFDFIYKKNNSTLCFVRLKYE